MVILLEPHYYNCTRDKWKRPRTSIILMINPHVRSILRDLRAVIVCAVTIARRTPLHREKRP
jgi:hypothetical protein